MELLVAALIGEALVAALVICWCVPSLLVWIRSIAKSLMEISAELTLIRRATSRSTRPFRVVDVIDAEVDREEP